MKRFLQLLTAFAVVFGATAAPLNHNLKVEGLSLKAKSEITAKKMNRAGAQTDMTKAGSFSAEKLNGDVARKTVRGMRKADNKATLEGEWIFTLGDYYFQNSEGDRNAIFEATIENGYVIFEDPTGDEFPFIAAYNSATNVLTFSKMLLFESAPYYLYQVPFVWKSSIVAQTIYAEFVPEMGIIEFEPDQGISYPVYTDPNGTSFTQYFDIFDLVAAEVNVPWNAMENGQYLDNMVYPFFGTGSALDLNTKYADVVVEQNPFRSGVYRVINPLKALYAKLGFNAVSPTLTIDATDPTNVLIAETSTGIYGGEEDGIYTYFNNGWYTSITGSPLGGTLIKNTMTVDDNGKATITIPASSAFFSASESGSAYYVPGESVLTFTIPSSAVTVEGNMTAQVDMNMGTTDVPDLTEPEDFEVSAVYDADNQTLTFSSLGDCEGKIMFNVNVADGTLSAPAGQVAYEGYGMNEESIDYMYMSILTKEEGVTGTIYNINDTQCQINLNPFGAGGDLGPDLGIYFIPAYFNAEIILDLNIDGLPGLPAVTINSAKLEPTGDNQVTLTVDYSTENLPAGSTVWVEVRKKWAPEGGALETPQVVTVVESSSSPEVIVIDGVNLGDYVEYEATIVVKNADDETIATSEAVDSNGFQFTSVDNILNDEAPARYFNLQGVEVANPEKGAFIIVKGNKASKVIF